jgi:hypothetical protein
MPEELNCVKRKVTCSSFIMALLLSATGLIFVNLATANPVMYLPYIVIKSDGSIEPQTEYMTRNGNVYTLTSDLVLSYAVKIECSDIIFDGGGHVIDGSRSTYPGYTRGLVVEGVTNVTVKNIKVVRFLGPNIFIENVSRSVFLRVEAPWLDLRDSDFNTIAESNIGDGVSPFQIRHSNNNTIIKNNINFLVSDDFNCNNSWDNGSVGNYWSGYTGVDVNGDGIGDTPYVINADNQDRYPLMNPWDPVIPYDTEPPRISILSPENKICNESSVPLTFLIYEPASSMSYSLDGQDNITIIGNSTISDLTNGLHNVSVYVKDMCGNVGASETVSFSVEVPFPVAPVTATSVAIVAVVGVGLLVYLKKRKR